MNLFRNVKDEKAVAHIVNSIVGIAHRDGASEVSIEPQSGAVPIFHKIKGEKIRWMDLPQYVLEPVVTRIKKMANMKAPQKEGLICVRMQDKEHEMCLNYNLRVNVTPTPFGDQVRLSFEDEDILY